MKRAELDFDRPRALQAAGPPERRGLERDEVRLLVTTERGHELGSRRKHWPHPSARWLRQCRRLNELAGRLPALLQGKTRPSAP